MRWNLRTMPFVFFVPKIILAQQTIYHYTIIQQLCVRFAEYAMNIMARKTRETFQNILNPYFPIFSKKIDKLWKNKYKPFSQKVIFCVVSLLTKIHYDNSELNWVHNVCLSHLNRNKGHLLKKSGFYMLNGFRLIWK